MRKTCFLFLLLVFLPELKAQENVLGEYIQLALENNLQLRQQKNELNRAGSKLKQANANYLPQLKLNARYTLANGGRVFDVPAGDLLNPVYAYLHQASSIFDPSNPFPNIRVENQNFRLLRPHEQETFVQLSQAIFNADIYANHRLNQHLFSAQRANLEQAEQDVISQVKIAYYNFLSAVEYEEILKATLTVVKENVRVSQKLYKYQKIARQDVYTAEADLSNFKKEVVKASEMLMLARNYFNLLLNLPLEKKIDVQLFSIDSLFKLSKDEYLNLAQQNRPELNAVSYANLATESYIKLQKGAYIPNLSFVGVAGIQGETYGFNGDHNFLTASLVLQWNLFAGGDRKEKVAQARIDQSNLLLKQEGLEQQIRLEVFQAYYACITALNTLEYSEQALKSSKAAFDLVLKKFNQGQSSQLEFNQARVNFTSAEKEKVISKYKFLESYAKLYKACGISRP